jgi:hypothetical protein
MEAAFRKDIPWKCYKQIIIGIDPHKGIYVHK